jgi:hypothetical protein
MADAYGMITFRASVDCDYVREELVNKLNDYRWDNSGACWKYSESLDLLYIDEYEFHVPQYPTVFVEKDVFWVSSGFGDELIPIDECNFSGKMDEVCDSTCEPIPLADVALHVSTCIKSGWIEIACAANEKGNYVYFESLKIHAGGITQRIRNISGPRTELQSTAEEFRPD